MNTGPVPFASPSTARRGDPLRWAPQYADAWLTTRHGEITVLFNPRSADTHLLSDLAMEVLALLRQAPASLEELLPRMGAETTDAEAGTVLARLLGTLDRLGLITPMP